MAELRHRAICQSSCWIQPSRAKGKRPGTWNVHRGLRLCKGGTVLEGKILVWFGEREEMGPLIKRGWA